MKITQKGVRKFTKKEKLKILTEAKKKGVRVTLEKYAVYPATYYYWKKKFIESGEAGLDHGMTKKRLARIRQLEAENRHLKELLGHKELESKLKDELLKKRYPNLNG